MTRDAADKVLPPQRLAEILTAEKSAGKKIVFTNGCFDILHLGHARYLQEARKLGDLLVIAINSDASVRRLKGSLRPIVPQDERAEMLGALAAVDYVTIFEQDDPQQIVSLLGPNILVKGGDWAADEIIGRAEVEADGGKVVRIPYIEGRSTTSIIEKVKSLADK